MTEDFIKIVHIGTKKTHDGRYYSVFCTIRYEDGKLSITGVEGPSKSGNCIGSCGQIEGELEEFVNFAKGWTFSKLQTFRKFWNQWHLNDMTAGSPRQEAFLNENGRNGFVDDRLALERAGLSPDAEYDNYAYGSGWLKRKVPFHVVYFLKNLPDADRPHPWGK